MGSAEYLRGEKTIDPYRNRDQGSNIVTLRRTLSFAIQCSNSTCGFWRKITTDNLPCFKFICFHCERKGQVKKHGVYQFNFKELPLGTNQDVYIKRLNDTIR